jgi:hypothetical protein
MSSVVFRLFFTALADCYARTTYTPAYKGSHVCNVVAYDNSFKDTYLVSF